MNDIEIKRISDTEIWLGENKATIIEGNIIFVIAKGEQSTEIAMKHQEIYDLLALSIVGKVNYLIDLNHCGKNSPEAREIWKNISEQSNTGRVATFGLNPVARVIASFVIGNYKQGNLRFFNTKEEAILWLTT